MKKLNVTMYPQEIRNAITIRLNNSRGETGSVKEYRLEMNREKRTIRVMMQNGRYPSKGPGKTEKKNSRKRQLITTSARKMVRAPRVVCMENNMF